MECTELIKQFSNHSSATVHEAMGRVGALNHKIKPIAKGMKICGTALTVRTTPCDNIMILYAIKNAKKGDVIIADCGRILESGPFGELAALECQTKGVAGFITSGSVRDSKEITEMGFPVFSSGISVVGTVKESIGEIGNAISIGDVIVNCGDIVLGDDDGVVIIPISKAEDVLDKSNKRAQKEMQVMNEIRQGKSIFDIYGYQKVFDRHGYKG